MMRRHRRCPLRPTWLIWKTSFLCNIVITTMIQKSPLRIATWSGPRNISTAMMRAWGNRPDTFVCDEPFYAYYLKATGRDHPGAAEVIARGETDSQKVIAQLTGPIPGGK